MDTHNDAELVVNSLIMVRCHLQEEDRRPLLGVPLHTFTLASDMGASVAASVAVIAEMVAQTSWLAKELSAGFEQHTHISITRGPTTWGDHVTDGEYHDSTD